MFVISTIANDKITNQPALWYYSPRCQLSCKQCILPVKTNKEYMKLDVVEELKPVRDKINSVVFYIGDLAQKHYIISKYINVIKSRWCGLNVYLSFSFPHVGNLWRYYNMRLIDGFIWFLHQPLILSKNGNGKFFSYSGCAFKHFLQSVFLLDAIKSTSIDIKYAIVPLYHPKTKQEIKWHNQYCNLFSAKLAL